MGNINIPLVEDGLTAYAIERQNGLERHQPLDTPPWADTRRFWINAILQGMIRLDGGTPGPALLERFDQRLEQARSSFASIPAPVQLQRNTIHTLQSYISTLEATGDDRRRQVVVVRDLVEDMASHLPWAGCAHEIRNAWEQANSTAIRITARLPIRFTRVLLGWETGPCESVYASGAVTAPEKVIDTALYAQLSEQYPQIANWPAVCVVYNGGGLDSVIGVRDAAEFDLDIMNQAGDRFLDMPGVRWAGGPYELRISDRSSMTMSM